MKLRQRNTVCGERIAKMAKCVCSSKGEIRQMSVFWWRKRERIIVLQKNEGASRKVHNSVHRSESSTTATGNENSNGLHDVMMPSDGSLSAFSFFLSLSLSLCFLLLHCRSLLKTGSSNAQALCSTEHRTGWQY